MKKTKLAKAVVIAATGATLSLGMVSTASAHVMYNTYTAFGLDGWTQGNKNQGTPSLWKGTVNGDRPFGYVGLQAQNWAATIHSAGTTLEVSQADSIASYKGFAADIDTANGAWGSWQVDPSDPTFTRGWAHNTDFGLIKSHVDTDIVIKVSKVNATDDIHNYGITVFKGMDDGVSVKQDGNGDPITFSHHSAWNIGYISGLNEGPAQLDDPMGTNGLTYLAHGDQSIVTFHAMADQVYSIYLGGNDVEGDIFGTHYGYKASISAVPVPAAAWLFGTGLMGLVSLGRRKQK